MTTDYNKTDGHSPTTRKLTGHNSRKIHRVRLHSDHHTHQYTHCQHNFHKHHTDGGQAQHTKGNHVSGYNILQVHTCKRKLANDFSAFLTNKILNIRSELGLRDTHTGGSVTNCFSGVPLNTFMDANEVEIWNIIKLSPVNSCELYPLPTWLLKEFKFELVPLITDIVNMSLRKSMITKSLKIALI